MNQPPTEMRLMMITADPNAAAIVQACGVDWIFVDLEVNGKQARQAGRNAVLSAHTLADVVAVRRVVSTAELLVRTNPWSAKSRDEIDRVIEAGADIVMLPFFHGPHEVEAFVRAVDGRARTCLLVETPEAVENIAEVLDVGAIDYAHVGLNDLHIAWGQKFMFEPLADGVIDDLCATFRERGLKYGFGGIARIGKLIPPAEAILAEHFRLGSTMAILSRSFCDLSRLSLDEIAASVGTGISEIRRCVASIASQDADFFEQNRRLVQRQILEVAGRA